MNLLPFKLRDLIILISLSLLTACGITQGIRNAQLYRVRSGDTLYAISWRYQLDSKSLAEWNNIGPPYTIHPGQELILVDPAYLPADRRPISTSTSTSSSASSSQPATTTKTSSKVQKPKSNRKAGPPPKEFSWPTEGKVVRKFSGRKSSSQGIDIAGQHGQAVNAAANGKVVYSGSGLTGYGKLIIVKHSDDYLSAYAHNSKLQVKEGEKVKLGQQIARMGNAEQDKPLLHFEVRKQGRPVDPLKYLPKR